jgi:hypothetical protein
LVPHPLYSPDIAPSNSYFFPRLKLKLEGKRFNDDLEIQQKRGAIRDYEAGVPEVLPSMAESLDKVRYLLMGLLQRRHYGIAKKVLTLFVFLLELMLIASCISI